MFVDSEFFETSRSKNDETGAVGAGRLLRFVVEEIYMPGNPGAVSGYRNKAISADSLTYANTHEYLYG